jgi:hypothetical protein
LAQQASVTSIVKPGNIWSGYGIYGLQPGNGQQVNLVSGTWVEPSYSGSVAGSHNCIWVGIDGADQQAGVTWVNTNNGGYYQPWVEFAGDKADQTLGPKGWTNGQINVNLTTNGEPNGPQFQIEAGDTITDTVQWVSNNPNGTATFDFTIQASGPNGTGSFNQDYTTRSGTPLRTCADWIVENPNNAAQPLANFGTVNLTNCFAVVGNTPYAANGTSPIDPSQDFVSHQFVMSGRRGSASPSGLNANGNGFSVSYGSNSNPSNNSADLPAAQAVNAGLADFSALDAAFAQYYQDAKLA